MEWRLQARIARRHALALEEKVTGDVDDAGQHLGQLLLAVRCGKETVGDGLENEVVPAVRPGRHQLDTEDLDIELARLFR